MRYGLQDQARASLGYMKPCQRRRGLGANNGWCDCMLGRLSHKFKAELKAGLGHENPFQLNKERVLLIPLVGSAHQKLKQENHKSKGSLSYKWTSGLRTKG